MSAGSLDGFECTWARDFIQGLFWFPYQYSVHAQSSILAIAFQYAVGSVARASADSSGAFRWDEPWCCVA